MNHSLLSLLVLLAIAFAGATQPALGYNPYRAVGMVWSDANCDGIRQATEEGLSSIRVSLIYAGEDQTPYTRDDKLIMQTTSNLGTAEFPKGEIRFDLGAPSEPYYYVIYNQDKPSGWRPAPYQQGEDRAQDNDLTLSVAGSPLWATASFFMLPRDETYIGTDIGLCQVVFNPEYTVRLPLIRR